MIRIARAIGMIGLIAPTCSLVAQTAAPRLMRAGDVDTIPLHRASTRVAYGADSLQFGELRIPDGRGPFPVAVVIHGGCWLSRYASLRNTAALAEALANAGVASWNIEYRRYDHPGGGWPGTFRDAADGADFVRTLARTYPLDTTRVVAAGHSAGGHLALWLATRKTLDAASPLAGGSPLSLSGVVSIGGIADLREFYARERGTCGNPAVESLLGGVPDSVPARLHDASPIERLPLGVPTVHIAGDRDFIAPPAVREAFVRAARLRGDSAWVTTIPVDGHFEAITPSTAAGRAVVDAILRLARGAHP
ncbi:MAG: alpha/beta hydrolase [Gemmatimonadaceae bacterium]|nr:alpha/beta hydrolase [Gemmatimonadaceae bacterium]